MSSITDTEVPLTAEGYTYHLHCDAEHLADNIILVGDPGRVDLVAAFLAPVDYRQTHREINVVTGYYHQKKITVISTGMGTDNVEIILNEIHILKEFDAKLKRWKEKTEAVRIVRLGTCGSPSSTVKVGDLAVTAYAVGLDNTCQYYNRQHTPSELVQRLTAAVQQKTSLKHIPLYGAAASVPLRAALIAAMETYNHQHKENTVGYVEGITCSASGFYGCQGRAVGRLAPHLAAPDLVEELSHVAVEDEQQQQVWRVINLEMESSALCFLSSLLGYQACSVCVVLAARHHTHDQSESVFLSEAEKELKLNAAAEIILRTLSAGES
ncbi:nucleoside phosphorylase-like protein [Angomonas deanei]|nr:nucleoside phosphorylase-like protein [Angomonas deanei]|eukprot:EPY35314.1 nucleoside phosphorylase-like protein [Angomonas deanei]